MLSIKVDVYKNKQVKMAFLWNLSAVSLLTPSTCTKGKWKCVQKTRCSSTCNLYGEGHITTFDGQRFVFDGNCEYILAMVTCFLLIIPAASHHNKHILGCINKQYSILNLCNHLLSILRMKIFYFQKIIIFMPF